MGDARLTDDGMLLIAGPCVIEGRDMALSHAERIRDLARDHGFTYCFKSSSQ